MSDTCARCAALEENYLDTAFVNVALSIALCMKDYELAPWIGYRWRVTDAEDPSKEYLVFDEATANLKYAVAEYLLNGGSVE